jgi:hypothetical protein
MNTMGNFPTIFDLLERFDFLRGFPAAYLVLAAAVVVVVVGDWRVSVLALTLQYLLAGLLLVDVLDPRLAIIKLFIGLFICLIWYITARQVSWGRLPVDITKAEAVQLRDERQIRFGSFLLPTSLPFRLFLALMMALVVWVLAQRPEYRLPVVPEHINLAIFSLAGMGLLGASLTSEPLKAGMGLLMFLSGFELLYSALDQSAAMLALLSAVELAVTLVLAYLTQARHAFVAIVD